MSDLRIRRQVSSVTRATDDDKWMNLRGTRDGAMISADWLTAMALEGRCFGVNSGTDTQAVTHNATYLATEPDMLITVPSGTTIIPVFIQTNFEDTDTPAVVDVVAVATSVYDAVTTDTDLTIYNMRMDAPYTSTCQAVGVVQSTTAATPLDGNYIEFWRGAAGMAEDAFNSNLTPTNELITRAAWNIKDSLVPPVIVGEGSLYIYMSGTKSIGFITAIWVELPSTAIK